MTRGVKHPPEVRAAVMAALLAGQGITEIAQQYKLPRSVIDTWKSQINSNHTELLRQEKEGEFDELLRNALRAILQSLELFAKFPFTRTGADWLQKQSAAELATYFGVATDKGFRLLEAAARARENEQLAENTDLAEPVHKELLQ